MNKHLFGDIHAKIKKSHKLQATLSDSLYKEMEDAMKLKRYYDVSEFVRHCIRTYLVKMEAT